MKILLDIIGQQHTVSLHTIHPDDIHMLFRNTERCRILIPAEYWTVPLRYVFTAPKR